MRADIAEEVDTAAGFAGRAVTEPVAGHNLVAALAMAHTAVVVSAVATASLAAGALGLVGDNPVGAGRTVVAQAVAATFPSSCNIEFSVGNG
jgi:hypothetical protein